MKRVLHCFNGLDNGGVEAFVMNVYRNIDRTKIQFDFLLRDNNRTHYWDEIESMGGRIFVTPTYPKRAISNYFETKKFLEEHREYETIHVHANSLIYMNAIKIAKKLKIKNRIIHSHNTRPQKDILVYLHKHNKKHIDKYANIKLACSNVAGEWMFDSDFQVINNGINSEKFRYNEKIRNDIRDQLGINDEVLIGNIGRFVEQKNHSFIIDVFSEYKKMNTKSKLLLMGFGELENDIRNQVEQLCLEDDVIILTDRNDAYNILQAVDVFLFPSKFEGLGISLVEAQASGLSCLVSDNIPKEAIFDNRVNVLSFDENKSVWANKLDILCKSNYKREVGADIVKSNNYDICNTCEQLIQIYSR